MTDMVSDAMLLGSSIDAATARRAGINSARQLMELHPDASKEELMEMLADIVGMLGISEMESKCTHKLVD